MTRALELTDPARFTRHVAPGEAVVIACSGGADSTALLHLAVRALRPAHLLVVAHLDHGLREGSAGDARFVASEAARLELPAVVERVDAGPRPGDSPEERARELRYSFLERVAVDAGAAVLLTAHHADDQAETVLLRAATGAGARGLAGMPPSRPLSADGRVRLARPLLDVRRGDLRAWLAANGIAWRDDPTNAAGNVRARLRHGALPALADAVGRDPVPALARLAENLRGQAAGDSGPGAIAHGFVEQLDEGRALVVAGCERLPRALRLRALTLALTIARGDPRGGSRAELLRLDRALGGDASESVAGVDLVLTRRGLLVCALDAPAARPVTSTPLPVPGRVLLPDGTSLAARQALPDASLLAESLGADGRRQLLDADTVEGALVVRPVTADDRMTPLGRTEPARALGMLARRGLDARARSRAAAVADAAGILWLVGHVPAHRSRLTPATRRVLVLETAPAADRSAS